jgi:hypothetical protein
MPPLNRGQINPLGDSDQVKVPGSYLAQFSPVEGKLEVSFLTHVHTAAGHLLTLGSPIRKR